MHTDPRPKDSDLSPVDPARAYASPRRLCEDRTTSAEQKIALLRQWEYDLRSIQVASEENMTSASASASGAAAELLQEVRRCLRALGDTADDHAATNKQGGSIVDN